MTTRKKKFCCEKCGAKETNFYRYKGDVTQRSFQVRFECGRIVTVLAKNSWKKQETKTCGVNSTPPQS